MTGPTRYHAAHDLARRDPETFWLEAAKAIDWIEPPRRAFDADQGVYGRWFPDAVWVHLVRRDMLGRLRQASAMPAGRHLERSSCLHLRA